MAGKIKVTPSVLTDQANKLNSLITGDLQAIKNKTNKAASLMMDSVVGKFMGNAHTKTTAISRQYSNLYDTLYTGVMVLQQSAKLFVNSDKDLTKDLDKIWAEVPDTCFVPHIPSSNSNSSNTKSAYDEKLKQTACAPQYSDKCTSCALVGLLRRKQILDGGDGTYSYEDIRSYLNGSFKGTNNKTDSIPYATGQISKGEIVNQNVSVNDWLKNFIDSHPEGVEMYGNYNRLSDGKSSQHAIVITDYEIRADGSIQYYALDPAVKNGVRVPIEETSLYRGCGGDLNKMFDNLKYFVYVK